MEKTLWFARLSVLKRISLIMIVLMLFITGCQRISNIPTGEFIKDSYSPKNTYVVKAYLCMSDATNPNSIRCEAINLNTGMKKNIYWEKRVNNVDIIWENDNVVKINNITLNLKKNEYYDWREHKSIDDDLEYWETYWNID